MCGGGFSALTSGEVDPQDPEKAATADAVAGSGASSAQSAAGAAGSADAAAASTGSAYAGPAAADDRAVSVSDPYTTEYFTDADKAPGVTALVIPASVERIDLAFFQLFPNAASIEVAPGNAAYSSENGLLLDAAETNLLLVPEGMEGEAVLPSSLATVPACVFSRCTKLSAIDAVPGGTADSAFTSSDGILYTADKATLVAAPAGLGASARIAAECTAIADGAFWGNAGLKTIIVPGNVGAIAAGESSAGSDARAAVADGSEAVADEAAPVPAFNAETVADATVVTAERAAWEAAGFTHFAEPAEAGDAAQADGFLFTLLADGTVSVGWAGEGDAPADLTIPATGVIDGIEYRVSRIADAGFADQSSIRAVSIPSSISVIGDDAFRGGTSLEKADLGTGVIRMGARAFEGTVLRALVIPESLQYIGEEALAGLVGTTIVVTHDVGIVARNVIASSTGLSIYVPAREDGAYAWDVGLPTAGNHIYPFALNLISEPLELEVNQEGYLFEGGVVEAPFGSAFQFSYNASAISMDEKGFVSARKIGSSTVQVLLVAAVGDEKIALASAARAVGVVVPASEDDLSDEMVEPLSAGSDLSAGDDGEMREEESVAIPEAESAITGDVMESFSFETEDRVPMVYSTLRLPNARAAVNSTKPYTGDFYIKAYHPTQGINLNHLETMYWREYEGSETSGWVQYGVHRQPSGVYIDASKLAQFKIRGEYIDYYSTPNSAKPSYSILFRHDLVFLDDPNLSDVGHEIDPSRDSTNHIIGYSTTYDAGSIVDGITLKDLADMGHSTIYGLFPTVEFDADSCNANNGKLQVSYKKNGKTETKSKGQTHKAEWNPFEYRIKNDSSGKYRVIDAYSNKDNEATAISNYLWWTARLENVDNGNNGKVTVENEGWYYLDDKGNPVTIGDTTGQKRLGYRFPNKTIYAQYPQYTVKLDAQGGTLPAGKASISPRLAQKMPSITPPTSANGNKFTGYFSKPNGQGGVAYYDENGKSLREWDIASNNMTLYAHWKAPTATADKTISLDFNVDGVQVGTGSQYYTTTMYLRFKNSELQTSPEFFKDYNCTLPFRPVMPDARSGYVFCGYYNGNDQWIDANGSPTQNAYAATGSSCPSTLTARFVVEVVQVTLNKTLNTGFGSTTGTTSYVFVKYLEGKFTSSSCTTVLNSIKVPTAATGYTFKGYFDLPSGGTQFVDSNGDYTVYFSNVYFHLNPSTRPPSPDLPADAPGTVTLFAQYEPVTAEVTLDYWTNEGYDDKATSAPRGYMYAKYNKGKYADPSCKTALTKIDAVKTKNTHVFDGYWTQADGGVQMIDKEGNFTSKFTNTYFGSTTSATLYARYKLNNYKVTFDANKPAEASGSISGTMSDQTIAYGETTPLKENKYTLTGWTFIGWNDDEQVTGTRYQDKQPVKDLGDTTLYATWSANTYNIRFDSNGGTDWPQNSIVKFTHDSYYPTISKATPKRPGYTFLGWGDDPDPDRAELFYNSKCEAPSGAIWTYTNIKTIYALWAANTDTPYTIKHYKQNITDDGYTVETEEKTGKTDTEVSPSANSYTGFKKVTTDLSKESGTIAGDGSLVLSFYYDRLTYTVSFVTNGGSAVGAQTIRYGGKVDKDKAITARAGYTFGGWYKDSALTQLYDMESAASANLTLYAKFTAKTDTLYKIEHYKQKLDGSYALYTTTNHQGTTDTTATAADKYQTYTGFHHVENSSSVESGNIAGEGTLVLKVYYDQNTYTIHFDGNGNDGGSIPADMTVKYEQPWMIDSSKEPQRTGYTYRGWQKDGEGLVYTAGTTYTTPLTDADKATVTLKAKWDNNPYRIVLDANGGKPSDVINAHYDMEWTIRADQRPERRGYFFRGWAVGDSAATAADYEMPPSGDFTCTDNLSTGDPESVTLFAVWQAMPYKVVFHDNGAESGRAPDELNLFYTDGEPNAEIPVYGYAPTNELLKKRGHHVIGWSTDPTDTAKDTAAGDWYIHGETARNIGLDGKDRVDDDDINQYVVHLYAIWAPNTYTVIFQKNQGDYVTDGVTQANRMSVDLQWGQAYAIKEWAVRGGFEFAGWEDESGERVYQLGDEIADLSEEDGDIVLLFARWQGAPYRVYFDGNKGQGQMWTSSDDGRYTNPDGVEFLYDSARRLYYTEMHFNVRTKLPLCGFWRDGYAFAGWTTERDDPQSISYRNGQLVLDLPQDVGGGNEITLYAFWEAQVNVSVPCIAVLQVDMDGMTGYNDGLPIMDVTDQFDADGCASSFSSRTPEDTYLSWVSCIPVEEGLRTVFPGAEYDRREDGSLQGTNDVSIIISDKADPKTRGVYNIGSDAGYKPTSNPFFKIPANGTLPLTYQLTVNRPEVEMGFREKPVQVAWMRYEISLVDKLTLGGM